jgi:hypothetical protein
MNVSRLSVRVVLQSFSSRRVDVTSRNLGDLTNKEQKVCPGAVLRAAARSGTMRPTLTLPHTLGIAVTSATSISDSIR